MNFKENHNKLKLLTNVNTTPSLPLTIIRGEGQSGHFDQFAGADLHPCCISPFVLHLLTTAFISLFSFTIFYVFIFSFFNFLFLYFSFLLASCICISSWSIGALRRKVILLHHEVIRQVPLHSLLSSCKLSYIFFLLIRVHCCSYHFGLLCLTSDSIAYDFLQLSRYVQCLVSIWGLKWGLFSPQASFSEWHFISLGVDTKCCSLLYLLEFNLVSMDECNINIRIPLKHIRMQDTKHVRVHPNRP